MAGISRIAQGLADGSPGATDPAFGMKSDPKTQETQFPTQRNLHWAFGADLTGFDTLIVVPEARDCPAGPNLGLRRCTGVPHPPVLFGVVEHRTCRTATALRCGRVAVERCRWFSRAASPRLEETGGRS